MFDALAGRLQGTLAEVRNRGTLSEQDVDAAMREIRLALLEADVNFKVARQFTSQLKERCLVAGVIGGLNPGQQVIKLVAEELTSLMGRAPEELIQVGGEAAAARILARRGEVGGGLAVQLRQLTQVADILMMASVG